VLTPMPHTAGKINRDFTDRPRRAERFLIGDTSQHRSITCAGSSAAAGRRLGPSAPLRHGAWWVLDCRPHVRDELLARLPLTKTSPDGVASWIFARWTCELPASSIV